MAMMKKYDMNVTPVADLWVKVGTTDLTSFVASLQQANPDLIMSSLLFTDTFIFMKQAHAAGLTKSAKLVMPAAGFQLNELKKEYTPEGMILGHNSMYFEPPNATPLLKEFVKSYREKTKLFPHFEAERAYSAAESWKAGVDARCEMRDPLGGRERRWLVRGRRLVWMGPPGRQRSQEGNRRAVPVAVGRG